MADRRLVDPERLRDVRCERTLGLKFTEGNIQMVDPDVGSTLTVSSRDPQTNCWVNWKIMGQPYAFQVLDEK